MKIKLHIALFICLFSLTVVAQETTLTAKVSKNKLGINQRLKIEFSINKQGGDNFSPPQFSNFKIVGGPSQSVSQSWINGKVTFSQSYSYIIQPKRKGELTIGAASIEIDEKNIQSKPIKIIVLDAVEIPKDPNDPNYIAQQNIHLVAEISKSNPFVGEGIYVEYRLYVSENISVYDTNVSEAPQYNGFWNQTIKINNFPIKMGKYNGENYRYIVLQKAFLIPTKTGKLHIEPMKMDIVIGVPTGRTDFFGNARTQNIKKEFASAKKTINPRALPIRGKPDNYTGAVGSFKFNVTLSKNLLKANESSQIQLAVKGKGNLKLFELPEIITPIELEKYQPERTEKVRVSSTGISGNVSDTYTIVPQYKGKYKIPKVSFSYFNPKKEKYQTITTKNLFVNVLEGKELKPVLETNTIQKQTVVSTGKNFRYIQTKSLLKPLNREDFFRSNLFYTLLLFPLLMIPIVIFIAKKNEKRNNDLIGNKSRKAERLAKKYLSEARKQLGKKEAFYESLERALHNYLKSKLGIETADISKQKITELLERKKINSNTIDEFIEVLKNSDLARYTPITNSEMKEEFERAKYIIVQLDKQL
jgi:hypothetical protein